MPRFTSSPLTHWTLYKQWEREAYSSCTNSFHQHTFARVVVFIIFHFLMNLYNEINVWIDMSICSIYTYYICYTGVTVWLFVIYIYFSGVELPYHNTHFGVECLSCAVPITGLNEGLLAWTRSWVEYIYTGYEIRSAVLVSGNKFLCVDGIAIITLAWLLCGAIIIWKNKIHLFRLF